MPDASRPARPTGPNGLRADARANRARLVRAARVVIGRAGVTAPLADIADEAGVGIGTLYRHFPDRDALLTAAFADGVEEWAASGERALTEPDPWDAFVGAVVRMGEIEARNPGFAHVIRSAAPAGPPAERRRTMADLAAARQRGYRAVSEVVRRGQQAGAIRADLTPQDLTLLSFAIAGILEVTAHDVPGAWRRHVAVLLDGCRADTCEVRNASPALPRPPEPRALFRAMLRTGGRRTRS